MSGFKDFDQDTPGNNASVGSINFSEGQNPSTVNDSARQALADIRKGVGGSEFSANSATTVDLSQIESNNIHIGGTTQIENFGVQSAGIEKNLRFSDALTIKHSAGAITCPGNYNITTRAGDHLKVVSHGAGHWRVITPGFATQAQMEAATVSGVTISPSVLQHHPAIPKAWGMLTLAGSATASYNVASVTDTGTGEIQVTLTTAFSSTNYSIIATAKSDNQRFVTVRNTDFSAGGFTLEVYDADGTQADSNHVFFAAYGDQ